MKQINNEKGQALIIIAIAAVVLIGFTALAIDGARVFEDKRHAQNAADTAALAGALAYSRDYSNDAGIETTAQARATDNGYDDNGTTNDVTVTVTTISGNVCPANLVGKEVQVDIESTINTTFGRILGRNTMSSKSTAVARACGTYSGPPFVGNAIVSLSQTGVAIGANGGPNINVTGGGLFSNSTGNPSVNCNGGGGSNNGDINIPSVTIPSGGTYDYGSCNPTITNGTSTDASQYSLASAAAFFPDSPACNGTATFSGGQWHPQAGADGSKLAFQSGDMDFAPGVYCFTTSPGSYTGLITGSEVTFYSALSNFKLSFQGNGAGIQATAPSSGDYKGLLWYLEPVLDSNGNLVCSSQEIELHGNGSASIRGAVIAPSAEVNITGNPEGGAYQSQIIGCTVTIGGSSDVIVQYDPNTNYQTTVPYTLSLLK